MPMQNLIETAESPAATPAGQPENKVEPSTENVMKKEFKVEGKMCIRDRAYTGRGWRQGCETVWTGWTNAG